MIVPLALQTITRQKRDLVCGDASRSALLREQLR